MIFIDQGEEGGWQDVFFFLPERAFCLRGALARGGFLQEGGFGRRGGVCPEGFFPVPIDIKGKPSVFTECEWGGDLMSQFQLIKHILIKK